MSRPQPFHLSDRYVSRVWQEFFLLGWGEWGYLVLVTTTTITMAPSAERLKMWASCLRLWHLQCKFTIAKIAGYYYSLFSKYKELSFQHYMDTSTIHFYPFPDTHFPHEPIFVPRPNATAEDDGVLLVGGFNSETEKGKRCVPLFLSEVSGPKLYASGCPPDKVHQNICHFTQKSVARNERATIALCAVTVCIALHWGHCRKSHQLDMGCILILLFGKNCTSVLMTITSHHFTCSPCALTTTLFYWWFGW